MRVLVTGGAGYIGSITVRRLLDRGHEVVVLDSLIHGYREAVDERARFIGGDVGDTEITVRGLEGCDAVLHCAGLIEVAESDQVPEAYWQANVLSPARLLQAMHTVGVSRLVFSSTAAVYGEPESTPIPEGATLNPVNTYGDTKLAFERMICAYERAYGLKAIRLRYFNVAGAMPDGTLGEAHDPETHIIPRILGRVAHGDCGFDLYGTDYPTRDGTCVRDYIHVYDLAGAHVLALERLCAEDEGGVFNLGSGRGFSNREIVDACSRVTGREIEVRAVERRPGDPATLVASSEAARSVLGWEPEYDDIETMIAHAWQWHQSHPNGFRTS